MFERRESEGAPGGAEFGSREPLIIAHRGASALAPENSLAAFRRAFDDGADGLEFDVRLASDGVPVVIHDATLKRTAGRKGEVAALSSAALAEVDVGSWFNRRHPARAREEYALERVATLASVLDEFAPRARALYVELKCGRADARPLATAVVEVLRERPGAARRSVVESFALEAVAEVKRLAPGMRAAALFERSLRRRPLTAREMCARALAHGADEIALQRSLATRRTVEAARAAGLPTVVWTADHPSWARRARAFGLHALITNEPARMRAALTLAGQGAARVG
ncbi:MAG TPA: glycerophosphodiester phosphodiesterase family protein [Pyrinomonadaceae bacterium]|jgi:glycerophosphoryl diester phosphodiesterase|nr:glycerophosphodiester phosphodiesterase family protein [Pyrinomonadaceae bacterium]